MIEYINEAKEPEKFNEAFTAIINIYNRSAQTKENEQFNPALDHTERFHCFFDRSAETGILLEESEYEETSFILTFASVQEEHRGKGHMKRIVEYAQKYLSRHFGMPIKAVKINEKNNKEYWMKLGFDQVIKIPCSNDILLSITRQKLLEKYEVTA